MKEYYKEDDMNNNDGMFTSEDIETLSKTKQVRLDLITDMIEDGVPTKSGDIRVLNETLDAADRQVLELAKIRAKAKEVDGNSRTLGLVIEVLSKVSSTGPLQISNKDIELADSYIPVDVVPGETDVGADELELSNFIQGNDDE